MAEPAVQLHEQSEVHGEPASSSASRNGNIMVYVDGSNTSQKAIPQAMAICKALEGEVTLVEAITSQEFGTGPVDPIRWNIALREAQSRIKSLSEIYERDVEIATEVLVGGAAERISTRAREREISIIALCTHGAGDAAEWDLGNTARRIVETVPGGVLLVPATVGDSTNVEYSRIMVPLDGSSRAESILPIAIKIARTHNAELLLVHAVAEPEGAEANFLDAEGARLLSDLASHNARIGRDYLDNVRRQIVDFDLSVRTLILRGGDARRQLLRVVDDEGVDLLVIASHGHCGLPDVPFGDVAAHLMARSKVPLLMKRERTEQRAGLSRRPVVTAKNRLPGQSVS